MGVLKSLGQALEDFIWGKDPESLIETKMHRGVPVTFIHDPKRYDYCGSHRRYHLKNTDHGYQTREDFLRSVAEEQIAARERYRR